MQNKHIHNNIYPLDHSMRIDTINENKGKGITFNKHNLKNR